MSHHGQQSISLHSHHQTAVTSERFRYADATSSALKIYRFPFPEQNNYIPDNMEQQLPASIDNISSKLGNIQVSPVSSPPALSSTWSAGVTENNDDHSDSDDNSTNSHPNKYPVEIEHHDNKFCSYMYKQQSTSPGKKLKLVVLYDLHTLEHETYMREIKHYQKHLVRICRCGRYEVMDGALQPGRANDCSGYEIHYSQKCRWKAYDDMVSGERVLIRFCKCYRPAKD